MCEYCSNEKTRKQLTERNTYSSVDDVYIGIDSYIDGNILKIEAVGEVGRPSKDTTWVEDSKRIKYCPMCGKKLKVKEEN